MLDTIKEKIWHRNFSDEELNKYIGHYEACYFTYAADEGLRPHAASGGSTSALLVYLLESGEIDGALVCRTVINEGKARPEFFIARTRDDIISAQGSKYSAVYFTRDAFPLIAKFDGRLAVVALPCDAKILTRTRQKNPDFDRKIAYIFTLFCGHNSEPELTDAVVDKLRDGHGELTNYVYRSGHWRGQLSATFADGAVIERPFSYFSDYRNVYFFAQRKCHHCFDHYGYYCDISAGDIWSPEMKDQPIKHTALISRSPAGQALLERALADGALIGEREDVMRVANGQARTMPFHYNISSRSRVGRRFFRLDIKDHTKERVRWNDYLAAAMVLTNERISRRRWVQRLILKLPRPLLKLYLFLLKGLESF